MRLRFRERYAIYVALTLPGTLAHELMHWLLAVITNGRPDSISLIPYRQRGRWILGEVTLRNPRWYNTGIIAFAPLVLPLLAYWFYRQVVIHQSLLSFTHWIFLYLAFEATMSAPPSREDMALAFKTHGIWLVLAIFLLCIYALFRHFGYRH